MRSTWIALTATAMLLIACSDDNGTTKKDTGTTKIDGKVSQNDGAADSKTPTGDAAAKKKVEAYVPQDNALSGWIEDPNVGKPGVQSAYTDKDIEDIIDGHNAPYAAVGTVGFAKQDYKNGKMILTLNLWEMKAATGAKTMFDKNKKEGETNDGLTFENQADVVTAGIINTTYDAGWTSYGHKGPYVWEIKSMTTDTAQQANLKAETNKFAALLSKTLP